MTECMRPGAFRKGHLRNVSLTNRRWFVALVEVRTGRSREEEGFSPTVEPTEAVRASGAAADGAAGSSDCQDLTRRLRSSLERGQEHTHHRNDFV